jgi:hypothetical protein
MIFSSLSKHGRLFSIGFYHYPEIIILPQILLALTITDQNMQYSHRCTNAFMGALSHFVLTSQFHKIQVTSEMNIGKNREGEVFYLMIMSVDEIL